MKKAIKSLVIAASVAAIAGIGAVSFAAWEDEGIKSGSAGGTLGSITAYGFDSALSETLTGTLMPYDQEDTSGQQVTFWSIELPTVTAAGGAKLQVAFASDPGLDAESGIYVKWSSEEVEAAPEGTTGYQKLTTSAADLTGATYEAESYGVDGGYLTVILDSDVLSDMGASFSITVTVVSTAA